jgi:hypothetical protein
MMAVAFAGRCSGPNNVKAQDEFPVPDAPAAPAAKIVIPPEGEPGEPRSSSGGATGQDLEHSPLSSLGGSAPQAYVLGIGWLCKNPLGYIECSAMRFPSQSRMIERKP